MKEVGLENLVESVLTTSGLILGFVLFAVKLQVLYESLLKGSASGRESKVPVVLDCVVTSSQQHAVHLRPVLSLCFY